MMKSAGYSPAAGMNLGGSILQQKTGPQDVDKLMQEFSIAFQVMEKGQVKIERAAPKWPNLWRWAYRRPTRRRCFPSPRRRGAGQEGTSVQAAMRTIEEMKIAGKEKEFGVNNDMNPYESVKAFGQNMGGRKQDFSRAALARRRRSSKSPGSSKKPGSPVTCAKRRGLVAGFGRMGTELGGFEMFEQIARSTPADFEQQRRARYDASDEGRQAKVDAAGALSEAELGARNEAILRRRQIAEVEVRDGGRFEHPFALDRTRRCCRSRTTRNSSKSTAR